MQIARYICKAIIIVGVRWCVCSGWCRYGRRVARLWNQYCVAVYGCGNPVDKVVCPYVTCRCCVVSNKGILLWFQLNIHCCLTRSTFNVTVSCAVDNTPECLFAGVSWEVIRQKVMCFDVDVISEVGEGIVV